MKTLCLYASYVDGIGLPYYSGIYVSELKKHFTDVIYLHSNQLDRDSIDFLDQQSVNHQLVDNQGFDFGQWKQALSTISLDKYDQLCLVNDSCILFASLSHLIEWFNKSKLDFGGLTKSEYQKEHIQSYFLLFNKNTFNDLVNYFKNTKTSNDIKQVISDFEIGLSQYLISKNYSGDSFLTNDGYIGEFSPYYQCVNYHIKNGSPMIKKKIIFSSFRKDELFTLARMNFDINIDSYINLIKENNDQLILSFEMLLKSEKNKLSQLDRIKYSLNCLMIQYYRKFKRD